MELFKEKIMDDIQEIVNKYGAMLDNLKFPYKPQQPIKTSDMTNAQYGEYLDAWERDVEVWKKQVTEYKKQTAYINNAFKNEVLTALGIASHPKAEKLWDMAWDKGHSHGFYQIASEAEELAELLL